MVGGLGGSNGVTRLGRRTVGEAAEKPGSAVCFGRRVDDAVALVGVHREPPVTAATTRDERRMRIMIVCGAGGAGREPWPAGGRGS